ncbi:MAG: right-handed parallel beta-helix repeat-containing protein, partial [Lachnospiraceae bacterium]|nr:right-handed parallel beta-helix repeat-containing protein [Lachnospiraceae bacterium]
MGRGRMFRTAIAFAVSFGMFLCAFPVSAFGAKLEKEEEPEVKRVVEAETVGEMMSALADNVTIVLKPGTYNITEYIESLESYGRWEDEGEDFPGVYVNEVFDGLELIINGYYNISIVSEDKDDPAEIVIEPRYADVLSFKECYNILIDSVSLGHTPEQGSCAGDVLNLEYCDNVVISDSELYGCGTYAFNISHSSDISALNCDIHDCTYGCAEVSSANDLVFTRCDFHDCKEYSMFELYNGTMDFIGCDFRNL